MFEAAGFRAVPGPLAGKTAIVTGAGQGAGHGVAEAFAAAGARVALVGRTRAKLDEVAAGLGGGIGLPVVCDVAEPDQFEGAVAAAVAAFGGSRSWSTRRITRSGTARCSTYPTMTWTRCGGRGRWPHCG
jgi:NAD(P)-dependent dehydrogenase (short-subunit alcohol dehydrogenase family)